jgi:hypothetical protein
VLVTALCYHGSIYTHMINTQTSKVFLIGEINEIRQLLGVKGLMS